MFTTTHSKRMFSRSQDRCLTYPPFKLNGPGSTGPCMVLTGDENRFSPRQRRQAPLQA